MAFASVGDRQEDLLLKELLRSGEIQGDGGEKMNALYTSAGMAPLPASKAVTGKAPKQAGHKVDCGPIDAASERDGKLCVAALANRAQRPDRVARLGVLDNEGAYAVAVSCGLFRALTCAMCDDALEVQFRWIEGRCFSYLHHFTTTLFRGERHRTDGGFGSVDADRFSAYLTAEPGGWYALTSNAQNVAAMALICRIDRDVWATAHRAARDVWTFFNLALTHRAVAVALFRLPKGGTISQGDCVRLVGLDARPELNGKRGRVVGNQGARLQVELDDGTQLALKSSNLEPEAQASSAAPATATATAAADLDLLLEDAVRLGALTEAQIDRWTDKLAEELESEHSLMLEIAPHVADAANAASDAPSGRNASACICAATTVRIFKATMEVCWAADERRDPGSTIEANVFQAAAMLHWWAKELGVGVDVGDLLQLDSSKRAMYRNFSMPMATATIKKGGTLTQEESMAVLMAAGGLAAGGKGGGGKGGGGKGGGGGGKGGKGGRRKGGGR